MNNPKNAAMQKTKLRRFYKEVALAHDESGFEVLLDDRPIRTPAKELLLLPTQPLAEAVASEWDSQGEFVELDEMRQMQFCCAAIDYTQGYRADVEEETAAYATTDLLCYRATEPEDLVSRQNARWNPWVDWAKDTHNLDFALVLGVMPVAQSEETMQKVAAKIAGLDAFSLTALWLAAKHTGSLVLAFTVLEQKLDAAEAFAISRLEEDFQNEQWGVDEIALANRQERAAEMVALGEFISLLQ